MASQIAERSQETQECFGLGAKMEPRKPRHLQDELRSVCCHRFEARMKSQRLKLHLFRMLWQRKKGGTRLELGRHEQIFGLKGLVPFTVANRGVEGRGSA